MHLSYAVDIKNPLVYYHGNCPDGWCAAYVTKLKFPDAELVPLNRGEKIPVAPDGRHVIMVDYSLSRAELFEMESVAKSIIVLDHHKTAQANLADLSFAHFDMDKSGASMAWSAWFPESPIPWYVSYVEDRDLWRWALPMSREINAAIMSWPMTIKAWSDMLQDVDSYVIAEDEGSGIIRHIHQYVDRANDQVQFGRFYGHSAGVINAQYMNISETLGSLVENGKAEIGIGWFERGNGTIQFSLRSRGDLDVSAIATDFGGGGHKNAAGFVVSIGKGRTIVDEILDRSTVLPS